MQISCPLQSYRFVAQRQSAIGTAVITASQKVHLPADSGIKGRRCASSFVTAAYFYVRLIPQDSRALHLELFAVPSTLVTFYEVIRHGPEQ
jgi:hypothetical protein